MRRGLLGFLASVALSAACSNTASTHSAGSPDQAKIEAAELALARGNFKRALRGFDRVLERDPANSRALLGSARANLSADRGEAALAGFVAYRSGENAWNDVEQWQYCRALALATDQNLASRKAATRALELAQRLKSEDCRDPRTSNLISRSELAVADEARRAGRDERALEVYLSLISAGSGVPEPTTASDQQGNLGHQTQERVRGRAYLAAAELLIESHRREEALNVLSRGLDELPADRGLVARMVEVLADESPTETPAELQSTPTE